MIQSEGWVRYQIGAKTPTCIAVSLNGKRFGFGFDCSISVWDEEHDELVCGPFYSQGGYVSKLIFSPNGGHLVSGTGDIRV